MIQFNHIFTISALDCTSFLAGKSHGTAAFYSNERSNGIGEGGKMRDWKNLAHGVCTGVEGGGMSPRVFTPCEFIYELDV